MVGEGKSRKKCTVHGARCTVSIEQEMTDRNVCPPSRIWSLSEEGVPGSGFTIIA